MQGPQHLSPYNAMVVESHEIDPWHNIIAAICNWLFLAGFTVFPGTFTALSHTSVLNSSQPGRVIQGALSNPPLLVLGILFCVIGGFGAAWFWWRYRRNYIWLIDRVLL
jgi:hypothetical protein